MSKSDLDKIDEQIKQLNAKKQRIKAKQNTQNRKDDTRRKILLGAVVLKKVESGDWPREKMISLLEDHLTKKSDRALFDLEPLPEIKGEN
jgi:hypothetical protein